MTPIMAKSFHRHLARSNIKCFQTNIRSFIGLIRMLGLINTAFILTRNQIHTATIPM